MKRIHFNKIYSTHLYAKESICPHFLEPTIVTADSQPNGIGTNGKIWIAKPHSSILFSLVYSHWNKTTYPFLSKIAANCLMDILSKYQIYPELKLPNDLKIKDKKICGILTEICNDAIITSFGLNISQTKKDLEEIDQPATSLFIETGTIIDPEEIIESFTPLFFNNLKHTLLHHR